MKKLSILFMLSITAFTSIAADISQKQKDAITDAVKAKLLDEDSAKFKFPPKQDEKIYCGQVNAKNKFGGYIGYSVFKVMLLDESSVYVIGVDSGDSEVNRISCAENGYFF